MSRKGLNFNDNQIIKDIYDCACEVYGNGIAVPTQSGHTCGWDWLDFSYIHEKDNEDSEYHILNYKFEGGDVSNGCNSGDFVGLTLKQILEITEGKFAFEVNCNNVDWYED